MTIVIDRVSGGGAPPEDIHPLYQKRKAIHPRLARGGYRNLKWGLMILLLGVYYGLPWVRWPRPAGAPNQAVMIDFAHGRFYFFMFDLWPDEVYYFTGLLVAAALGLFLTTAWLGRLWCGYACPQTVWTDLFLYVERLFEGDRAQRLRAAAQPLTPPRLLRKLGKHAVWLAIAAATGGAWIFYFNDAPTLWSKALAGEASIAAYLFFGVLTFTTYTLAGTMREQVCTYMCPWPRFQGAMIDRHSLQVTYRYDRGEPRGPHRKGDPWEGRGDCIDCKQCVFVCPMGIDIRDGSQLECINCALCIDACDEIMTKVDRPTGLIGYDSDDAVAARARGETPSYRFIRPRTIFYGAALAIIGGVMIWGFQMRTPFQLHVARDRNPLFVRLSDGSIRNSYTVKLVNRLYVEKTFKVEVKGLDHPRLQSPGLSPVGDSVTAAVQPGAARDVRLLVTASQGALGEPLKPLVIAASVDGQVLTAKTVFISEGGKP